MTEAQTALEIASHRIRVAIGALNGVRVSTWDPVDRELWSDSMRHLGTARENVDLLVEKESGDEAQRPASGG